MTPLWFSPNGALPPDPAVRKLKNWRELDFLLD